MRTAMGSPHRLCALITLDVKNAFNSATWSIIIQELRRREIPKYLVNLVGNYFTDRKIRITKKEEMGVTMGVPQGSVLGPTLWNILYDGVLRQDLGAHATAIGYADDLAVVTTADDVNILELRTNEAIRRIIVWINAHNLRVAPEKTEAVILRGSRRCRSLHFEVHGVQVTPKTALKYLGIMLDNRGTYGEHIKYVVKKADSRVAALTRILPNIGGPTSQKRAVLNGVTQSILLYGAPVWHKVIQIKRYAELLEKSQRKMLLRISSAYRTASSKALQVITGIPPITLLVAERRDVQEQWKENNK